MDVHEKYISGIGNVKGSKWEYMKSVWKLYGVYRNACEKRMNVYEPKIMVYESIWV